MIIPAFNEEEALPLVLDEVLSEADEVIVVNDGSSDETYSIAIGYSEKHAKLRVFTHERNLGKVAALRTGVENTTKDIIIFTDADYTYPASSFKQLTARIEDGADLVLGSRFKDGVSNMGPLNTFGNRVLSFLLSYITGMPITDGQTGLRAFKRKDYALLDVEAKGLEYETKMTVKAAKLGYRIDEIPIKYRKRIGKSKLNHITDGYKMFMSLFITALNETSPLAKTMIYPSILSSLIGVSFGLVSIGEYFSHGGPILHPYYPLISVLFLLIGAQFFSMGFLMDNLTKKMQRIEDKLTREKK